MDSVFEGRSGGIGGNSAEIDQQPFERELEFVFDDGSDLLVAVIKDVNNVGDVTSKHDSQ